MHYHRLQRTGSLVRKSYPTPREQETTIRHRCRAEALKALGSKCQRCGFSDPRALQIDHPKGNGALHRKEVAYSKMLKDVVKNPQDYQLLCANCNWIKRDENREFGKAIYQCT